MARRDDDVRAKDFAHAVDFGFDFLGSGVYEEALRVDSSDKGEIIFVLRKRLCVHARRLCLDWVQCVDARLY